MRYAVSFAGLVVLTLIWTAVLAPSPDAISMMYCFVGLLTLPFVGFWLGRWVTRREAPLCPTPPD